MNNDTKCDFCGQEECDMLEENSMEATDTPLGLEDDSPAYDTDAEDYYDDSMDGDHESALRDAGMGTDEDYGYYENDCYDGGDW